MSQVAISMISSFHGVWELKFCKHKFIQYKFIHMIRPNKTQIQFLLVKVYKIKKIFADLGLNYDWSLGPLNNCHNCQKRNLWLFDVMKASWFVSSCVSICILLKFICPKFQLSNSNHLPITLSQAILSNYSSFV